MDQIFEIRPMPIAKLPNHFLGKVFDDIGYGISQGAKWVAEEVAVKPVARKTFGGDRDKVNQAVKTFHTSGIADEWGTGVKNKIRDAAIMAGTMGVGTIASGVQQGATAAKVAQGLTTVNKLVNTGAKVAGAAGVLSQLKNKKKSDSSTTDELKTTDLLDSMVTGDEVLSNVTRDTPKNKLASFMSSDKLVVGIILALVVLMILSGGKGVRRYR